MLQFWLQQHSYDFRITSTADPNSDQNKLVNAMQNFIDHISSIGFMQSAAQQLKESLKKYSKKRDTFSTQKLMFLQKQITSLSSKATALYKHLGSLPQPRM